MKKIPVILLSVCLFSVAAWAQDQPLAEPVVEQPVTEQAPVEVKPEPVTETVQAPKEVKPEVKTEKPKPQKVEEKVAAPVTENTDNAKMTLLDVTRDDFRSKRIPDIKIESVVPTVAAEVKSDSAPTASGESNFFSFSLKMKDRFTQIAIVLALLLVIVILKLRDKKKNRKVFRVKNR